MENTFEAKKGKELDGVLVVKFHDFNSLSYKTAMAVERPWKSLDITTLRQLILFLNYIGAAEFLMSGDLSGCRLWA